MATSNSPGPASRRPRQWQRAQFGDRRRRAPVSESGFIEGNVEVTNIVMNGTVNGDMRARERLVLGGKARVNGNVHYGVIEMAPGAVITGKLVPLANGPAAATGNRAEADAAVAAAKSGA